MTLLRKTTAGETFSKYVYIYRDFQIDQFSPALNYCSNTTTRRVGLRRHSVFAITTGKVSTVLHRRIRYMGERNSRRKYGYGERDNDNGRKHRRNVGLIYILNGRTQ